MRGCRLHPFLWFVHLHLCPLVVAVRLSVAQKVENHKCLNDNMAMQTYILKFIT